MALTELLAALEAEAAAETAALDADSREEARRIVETAQSEARAIEARALRAGGEELAREAEGRRARARLAAAARVREAHEASFLALLAEVGAQLATVRESASYPRVLRALVRESLAALPDATVLRVDPRDERLAEQLLGELGVATQVAGVLETSGGVELAGDDGRTVRNTFDERLANAEPALRVAVAELLAAPAPDGRRRQPDAALGVAP
jgi:V/A-type H+-transporting ATPase subunit E